VRDLALAVLGEALEGHPPRLVRAVASDHAHAHAEGVAMVVRVLLARRLRVLHRGGPDRLGRGQPGGRRPGDQHPGEQLGRKRGREAEVLDVVVAALEGHRALAAQQVEHDARVFHGALVALVVRRLVAERDQVVLEAAGEHVQEDPSAQ
jgi:hypothetical protein